MNRKKMNMEAMHVITQENQEDKQGGKRYPSPFIVKAA
jgi:hypothetical protein